MKLPSNVPPSIGEMSRLQDDPGIRNAKIKLNYKKSFQDDHIFFPEAQELLVANPYRSSNLFVPNELAGYQPPMNNAMPLNDSYSTKRYQPNQQHHKENLLSLLALKNLEKQQQQQQYKHKPQYQVGYQPLHRNGQVYYQDTQPRPYGEQHAVSQNPYNYSNLQAQG